MLTEKDVEMMSTKVLNLEYQSFTFSKFIEKFKVKCVTTSDNQKLIFIDIVNYEWSVGLFDEFETFGQEFLYTTTKEIEKTLQLFDLKFPSCEIDVNIVRQYGIGI